MESLPLSLSNSTMGFLNKIMKGIASSSLSAITGTTDTVAKHYLKIKQENPELPEKEIYRAIIQFRYSVMPLKEEWRFDMLMEDVEKAEKLRDLILDILAAESPELLEAGSENISMMLDVIGERLEKEHGL